MSARTFLATAVAAVLFSSCGSGVPESTDPLTQFTYDVNGVTLNLVEVPGNAFSMGLTSQMSKVRDGSIHEVVLDGYAISETPVSGELWNAVMGGNSPAGKPVGQVTWDDAVKFTKKLSKLTGVHFTLPTEAQWEYASRESSAKGFNTVNEWVADYYESAYGEGIEVNPQGPVKTEKRVYRSTTERNGLIPSAKAGNIGFRVAVKTNKPVDQVIADAFLNGKPAREDGERKTEVIKVGNTSFKMVLVKGGDFDMGGTEEDQKKYAKTDEKPVHKVTLSDYEIGETEVTVALWNAVMGSLPRYNDAKKDADKPVCNVSWYEAQSFILKLNELTGRSFRLPTEAEWEFAARGRKSRYNRYAGSDNVDLVAWYGENANKEAHPVKGKKANELGLYDMAGNVWEWCQDWSGPYQKEDATNPGGPDTGVTKINRGGSCEAPWSSCRVSNRQSVPPANFKKSFGLRLAL